MRLALDKLSGVKADLVKLDGNWQERVFPHLVNSVRKKTEEKQKKHTKSGKTRF